MIRLQQKRLDAFLTVDELAEKAGVSPKTIRNLEEGRGARVETLKKLSETLKVAPSELLRGVPEYPVKDAA